MPILKKKTFRLCTWWNSFEENKNSFDSINLENNDSVLKQ